MAGCWGQLQPLVAVTFPLAGIAWHDLNAYCHVPGRAARHAGLRRCHVSCGWPISSMDTDTNSSLRYKLSPLLDIKHCNMCVMASLCIGKEVCCIENKQTCSQTIFKVDQQLAAFILISILQFSHSVPDPLIFCNLNSKLKQPHSLREMSVRWCTGT